MLVLNGNSWSHICEGATGRLVIESYVTGSDVSHVTGSGPDRKYAMRMRNRKLCNIRTSGPFHRKWRQSRDFRSRDRKRSCPEAVRKWSCAHAQQVHFVLLRVVVQVQVSWLPVTEGHVTPKGWTGVRLRNRISAPVGSFHRKLATGSHVIFPRFFLIIVVVQSVDWGFSMTSASSPLTGYLPLLFSYNIQ